MFVFNIKKMIYCFVCSAIMATILSAHAIDIRDDFELSQNSTQTFRIVRDGVRFTCADGVTIISSGNSAAIHVEADFVRIDNCHIRGQIVSGRQSPGVGVHVDGVSGFHLTNSSVKNLRTGVLIESAFNTNIRSNKILYNLIGLEVYDSLYPRIRNNVIGAWDRNERAASSPERMSTRAGILAENTDMMSVHNNYMDGNGYSFGTFSDDGSFSNDRLEICVDGEVPLFTRVAGWVIVGPIFELAARDQNNNVCPGPPVGIEENLVDPDRYAFGSGITVIGAKRNNRIDYNAINNSRHMGVFFLNPEESPIIRNNWLQGNRIGVAFDGARFIEDDDAIEIKNNHAIRDSHVGIWFEDESSVLIDLGNNNFENNVQNYGGTLFGLN